MCEKFQPKIFLLLLISLPNLCISANINNATTNNNSSISIKSTTPPTPIPPRMLKPLPLPLPLTQQQESDMKEKCQDFIDNSPNNEFHSPNYPDNYFNDVNCVKVISAGEGEVIRLRFLDHFHIEPGDENCQYDYLEIRDGQYGYSTHIVTLCGSSPPTVIESSGRHLWLRFHSDMDIHYKGFNAFYEFVPSLIARPDLDDCNFHLTTIEAEIKSEELSQEILVNRRESSIQYLDSTWLIEAPPYTRIWVQFEDFILEKANDCTFNFVEVYGSRTEYFGTDGILKQYCGSETETVQSKSNVLHIRFFTVLTNDNSEIGLGFKTKLNIYYNFFRDLADKVPSADGKSMVDQEPCHEPEEFDCTDSTCIDKSLTCNLKPNCKQRNDEDKGKCNLGKATFKMTMDLIVIAFIGCFLAAGMCSGLFLNICRKLRQDKIELEEIRASLHKSSHDSIQISTKNSSKRQSKDDLKSIQEESNHHRPSKASSSMAAAEVVNEKAPSKSSTVVSPQQSNTTPSTQSSQETGPSSSSKETIVYRPYYNRNPIQPEVLIGGSGSSPQTAGGQQYGFVLKQQQQPPPPQSSEDVNSTTIPYSPPPPYNPLLNSKYNAFTSSLQSTPKPGKKSVSVQDEQDQEEPEEEPVEVIEVRDCACQTKESFTERYLRDVYFGQPKYYAPRPGSASSSTGGGGGASSRGQSTSVSSLKRAPLARGEAVEMIDSGGRVPPSKLRRVRGNGAADLLAYPRSPGSIASSVDASTGSLELLSELDEEVAVAAAGGGRRKLVGSNYNELE